MNKIIFWILIIGNILKEYDSSLYAFLAYRLTTEFFGNEITISNLMKSYAILTTTIVVEPLGVLIFNRIAAVKTPSTALNISILGMGIATFTIGLIPNADSIGICAPIILIVTRIVQGIFGAGETNISSMHLIAIVKKNKGGSASGYYNISIVLGILLASLGVQYFDGQNQWRILYLIGGITAIVGAVSRYFVLHNIHNSRVDIYENLSIYRSHQEVLKEMINNKILLFRVIAISMFSYMTYYLTFVCIDALVPQLNPQISHDALQMNNTMLLLLDASLFFFFVWLAEYVNYRYVMLACSLFVGTVIPTMFLWLKEMTPVMIVGYKIVIVIFGVGFCTFLNQHVFSICRNKNYYWFFGIGYTIAGSCIGSSLPSVVLLIYDKTHSLAPISLYLATISMCTFLSVLKLDTNMKAEDTATNPSSIEFKDQDDYDISIGTK